MWFRNRKAIRDVQDALSMHADAAMHRAVSAEVLLMTTAELVEFAKSGEKYSSIAAVELVRRADDHDKAVAAALASPAAYEYNSLMLSDDSVYSLITIGEVS